MITVNVNGVNSGGGNNNQPPTTPPPSSAAASSSGYGQNSPMPTSDRMINDIRAEISRRGVILIPGTQNFSTMLNTIQQNQRTNVMGFIDNQYAGRIADIDSRRDNIMSDIKARLDASRNQELSGASSQAAIDDINRRYDNLLLKNERKANRLFAGEYEDAARERDTQKEEAEQRLAEAMQRLTEELSQGNKDSYLNNLRDKYKEQVWRRDNADTEEEARIASREAAKIQERMQRAMGGNQFNLASTLMPLTSIPTQLLSGYVQLDRNAIQQDYVGFDMASSVLNGNAFAVIRQQNALKEQENQMKYGVGGSVLGTGAGVLGGLAYGAATGSSAGPWGAIIGALVGAGVGMFGAHQANRDMMIEDERTKVADLWRQEESRIMMFNDLAMLTRGTNQDIHAVRQQFVDASGERDFRMPTSSSSGGFLSSTWSAIKNFFGVGGYEPSAEIMNRIAGYEGASMSGSTKDPLSGQWVRKNNSFEKEARGFTNALPSSIREQVLSNRELADNLYSYSYNVGADNFKQRVVPALERYFSGSGSVDDITSSMWAEGDKVLRGLRTRRAEERAGVRRALTGSDEVESSSIISDVWRRSESNLDLYDLGYTAPEFAQKIAQRIKQRGFVGGDYDTNALYADALERVFSMNPGALGALSAYDRFGRNNANQDFANLAYTLDALGTTGMRQGGWARSDEFAGYMTQLQQGQRSTFLTVDNARAARQIATGQAIFGDRFGSEAMQGIQAANNMIQHPGGGFKQTLLYDVIQELFPETRGRIDLIEQAQYDPSKQNEIQQALAKRTQAIYGGVDTTSGYLAMQEMLGVENPNVFMPIAKQLTQKGGLEAQGLKQADVESVAGILNNGYTPETSQRVNAAADQQMKSLLGYQEQISTVVQNILDKIETSIAEKLQEAVDNLK